MGARGLATALPADAPVSVEITADGVAIVRFDAKGEKMNTLSGKLMASFDSVLSTLESDPAVRAGVLISSKPDNFIAGADIAMLVRDHAYSPILPHVRLTLHCCGSFVLVWGVCE
ncbi:MAG: enoyl-CoA hydratase-related protein [Terracidiphilus sp.]|nr:enoyl-CoA hydratase-related protein [Terracidiphilus sp.]